jgi:two-component system NtrC family sensor kinase
MSGLRERGMTPRSGSLPAADLDALLARRLDQVESLGRVAHALAGVEDADRTMQLVATEGMRVFGAERAAVFLFDRTKGTVRCMVALGLSDQYLEAVKRHFQDLPSARAVLVGVPHFSTDAAADPASPISAEIRREGFVGVAALPLVFTGEAIGSLAFYHDTPRAWADDERRLAIAFADQAALAIGKSRLLDQVSRIKREWQSAFDSTMNGLAIVGPGGDIIRANRFVAQLAGVPVTSLPGLDLRALFVRWPDLEQDPLREVLETGRRVSVYLEGRGGRHLVLTVTPHPDGDLVVSIDDLTELRRLEDRFSRVVQTAHEAIVITGPSGNVVSANRAALELFGRAPGALVGRVLAELLSEEEPVGRPEGPARRFGATIRRGDTVRHVTVSSATLDEQGTVAGDVVLLRDVTEERLAAQALRRSEARYRALFDKAPIAIFTLDREGRFQSANRAALRIAGLERPAAGLRLEEFLLPAEVEMVRTEIAASLRGETRDFIFHFRRTDGAVREAAMVSVPVEEPGGALSILAIARDVTDEAELRERLTQSEKMAALGQLVSGVAHELNNPLAGIAALAQALLFDPQVDESTGKILQTVRGEAMRAARIVTDLLTFARQRPLIRGGTDLNDVVREAFAAGPALTDGITWRLELDPALPGVNVDAGQIRQVVTNLLTNAAQAMGTAPVRQGAVRTWSEAGIVGFEVTDSGTGIAPEDMPRIFEPFFTTKNVGAGTGLGLSISHGIVRAHGGGIHAQNRPQGGARFWFELPRDSTRLMRGIDG